jgi:hypothetical protein
LRNETGRIQ